MDKITGKNNELIKDVKRLISSSRKRKDNGLFVLEGARLTFDVLNSLYEVETFLITESAYGKYKELSDKMSAKANKSFFISDDVAQRLSETKSSQGVFAVCRIKDNAEKLNADGKYLVLDNVQDPGNLGTIIRTAEALGITAVLVGGGCDVYNPKVLRASMGSVMRLPVFEYENAGDAVNELKGIGLKVFSTSPDSGADDITKTDFSAAVIGNEANGVSAEVEALCDGTVTIKMLGNAESLNASVAAAITMWEMLR